MKDEPVIIEGTCTLMSATEVDIDDKKTQAIANATQIKRLASTQLLLAVETGLLLNDIKNSFEKRGDYLPWIEANMPVRARQCRTYLQLAKGRSIDYWKKLAAVTAGNSIEREVVLLALDANEADTVRETIQDNDLNFQDTKRLIRDVSGNISTVAEWVDEYQQLGIDLLPKEPDTVDEAVDKVSDKPTPTAAPELADGALNKKGNDDVAKELSELKEENRRLNATQEELVDKGIEAFKSEYAQQAIETSKKSKSNNTKANNATKAKDTAIVDKETAEQKLADYETQAKQWQLDKAKEIADLQEERDTESRKIDELQKELAEATAKDIEPNNPDSNSTEVIDALGKVSTLSLKVFDIFKASGDMEMMTTYIEYLDTIVTENTSAK